MKRISLKTYNILVMKIVHKINDIMHYMLVICIVKVLYGYCIIIGIRLNASFVNDIQIYSECISHKKDYIYIKFLFINNRNVI